MFSYQEQSVNLPSYYENYNQYNQCFNFNNPSNLYNFDQNYINNNQNFYFNSNYLPNYQSIQLSYEPNHYITNPNQSSNSINERKKRKQDSEPDSDLKRAKKVKDDVKCEICGDMSSGFHYGAFTCEACKLFFSRVTKNKRKRKFEECYTKNCVITVSTRSECAECRFKKCLTIGLSITKSRYGRSANVKAERKFDSVLNDNNLNSKFIETFNETKSQIQFSVSNLSQANLGQIEALFPTLMKDFTDKIFVLIDKDYVPEELSNFAELKYKFLSNHFPNNDLSQYNEKLNVLFVFYCLLFQIDVKFKLDYIYYSTQMNTKFCSLFRTIETNLSVFLNFLNNKIFNLNEKSKLLVKILSFIHVSLILFQTDKAKTNNRLNRTVADLLKAELSIMYNKHAGCSPASPNSDLSYSDQSLSLDQSVNSSDSLNFTSTELFTCLSQIVIHLNSIF